jgi:hypothetical protein
MQEPRFPSQPAHQEPDLLQLADFKWLVMACEGHHLDLGRMQNEPGYALRCVQRGLVADHPTVRRCAKALLAVLNPAAQAAPAPSA